MSLRERLLQSDEGRRHLETVEGWLEFQPEPELGELQAALSRSDEEFYSAELELYVGKVLAERDLPFRRHPPIEGSERRPDYLVAAPGSSEFFIEARASVDVAMVRRNAVMSALRDELDAVEGPEWVHLTIDGELPGGLSPRRVRGGVEEALATLRTRGDPTGEPMLVYEDESCRIVLEVLDVDPDNAGPVVGGWQFGSIARNVDTGDALTRTIARKAGRYGDLGAPFVIAVFAQREFPVMRHSVVSAIYGTRQWNLRVPRDPAAGIEFLGETSARDGIFTSVQNGEPIRTRVSAVAVYDRRNRIDGRGSTYEFAILHNPYARYPLSPELFGDIPQFVQDERSTEETVTMSWTGTTPEWWD